MEKVRLVVYDSDIKSLVNILHAAYTADYTKSLGKHYVFTTEHYNLFLGYRVCINVLIENTEDMLVIDIVGIGGSTSFPYFWGNVSSYKYVKQISNVIIHYCNENNIKGKQVKGESTF